MAHATSTTNRTGPGRPGHARSRRRGFTLIEALIASTVLAAVVVAVGASLSASVRQSAVLEQETTGLMLARQLMEEIAARPFLDPDTGTASSREASRALYDNVGDYAGYQDTISAAQPATTIQGKAAAVTGGKPYARSVAVQFRATATGTATSSGNFALVTVTVTMPDGRNVSVSRMVANTTMMQR